MVKNHSDSERGNSQPPLDGFLFLININGFCYTSRGTPAGTTTNRKHEPGFASYGRCGFNIGNALWTTSPFELNLHGATCRISTSCTFPTWTRVIKLQTQGTLPKDKHRHLSVAECLELYHPMWTKGKNEEDKPSELHVVVVSPTQKVVEHAKVELKRKREQSGAEQKVSTKNINKKPTKNKTNKKLTNHNNNTISETKTKTTNEQKTPHKTPHQKQRYW